MMNIMDARKLNMEQLALVAGADRTGKEIIENVLIDSIPNKGDGFQPVICNQPSIWCPYICITPETMITLADGTEKRVDEVKDTDRLMVYDFDRGCISEAPITFFHRVNGEAPVIRVTFSDGTEVGVAGEHGFFDMTDRKFVAINNVDQEKELKGHRFAKITADGLTEVALTGIRDGGTADSYYSPVTEAHFNCFAAGMLSISGYMNGLYNVFELEENELKYNAEKMAAEIEAVGEMPYEALAGVISRERFERNKAGWFLVSIAKGLITAEELLKLLDFCRPFFVGEKKPAA